MALVRSSEEFINEIRALDERLKNVKVKAVEIDKGARFVRELYVDGKPCILVFERDVRCRG